MRRESAHNETPLPSGYKQLEYIGYDNRYYNQFIQTNITQVKWRYSYYFEVIIPQKVNIDDEGDYYYNYDYMIVHGCRGGGFGQRNKFCISQKRFAYPSSVWGSTVFQPPIDFTTKHKIYENYDNVTIDGIYYTISRSQSATYTNNSNLLLFKSDDVPNGHAANVGSQSHHLQLNVWYKRCVSYFRDGGHQTLLYCNGSLDWTANYSSLRWSALTTPQQGVEWQNMGTYVTDYNNHYTYLKNLMIFNRNLSQQDIIEIQG